MARWRVVGDIVCGAFATVIEADTKDEALERAKNLGTNEYDNVSSEREFGHATWSLPSCNESSGHRPALWLRIVVPVTAAEPIEEGEEL